MHYMQNLAYELYMMQTQVIIQSAPQNLQFHQRATSSPSMLEIFIVLNEKDK